MQIMQETIEIKEKSQDKIFSLNRFRRFYEIQKK